MRLFSLVFIILLLFGVTSKASVSVTVNGISYTIPQTNERGWGTAVTSWIQAISSNTLQPVGGSFTLSSEVDFGALYGFKTAYLKSRSSNIATAGFFRLSNTDSVGFRNAGNTADLLLGVNGSDQLVFNSSVMLTASVAATLTNKTIDASLNTISNITEAMISSSYSRTKIATSNANYVLINDGLGVMSGEAQLAKSRGGTGADNSSVTFPTSGTIPTLAGVGTFSNKTFSGNTIFNASIIGSSFNDTTTTGAAQTLSAGTTTLVTVSNASLTSIAGIAGPVANQFFVLVNNTGAAVTVLNNSASATAGLRIITGSGSDITLASTSSLWLYYSPVSSAWQIVGGSGSGGSANVTTQTGTSYSILNTDGLVIANPSATATFTLPTAVGLTGKSITVKNISIQLVKILTTGGQTIDGLSQKTLVNQYDSLNFISNGSNWFIW